MPSLIVVREKLSETEEFEDCKGYDYKSDDPHRVYNIVDHDICETDQDIIAHLDLMLNVDDARKYYFLHTNIVGHDVNMFRIIRTTPIDGVYGGYRFVDGYLHSLDKEPIIMGNKLIWYKYGKKHNENIDQPAVIDLDNKCAQWWFEDQLHGYKNGPAHISKTCCMFLKNGIFVDGLGMYDLKTGRSHYYWKGREQPVRLLRYILVCISIYLILSSIYFTDAQPPTDYIMIKTGLCVVLIAAIGVLWCLILQAQKKFEITILSRLSQYLEYAERYIHIHHEEHSQQNDNPT